MSTEKLPTDKNGASAKRKASLDEILDHDYDGIKEYDNCLPLWWQYLFIVTTVIAVIYVGYFHFGPGLSQEEIMAAELTEMKAEEAEKAKLQKAPDEQALLALAGNQEVVKKGSTVFTTRCVACHGPLGQGLVGPNLTDDYWIHGGKITNIKTVVENGVLEKGMLSWKAMLSAEELDAVVAFVWSIHGSNPPNVKPPQGDLVKRE